MRRLMTTVFGSLAFILAIQLFILAKNFQDSLSSNIQSDLNYFVASSNSELLHNIERFTIAAQSVAGDKTIQNIIDDPNVPIDVKTIITRQKIIFNLDFSYLLSSNGRVLFSDTKENSILLNQKLKEAVSKSNVINEPQRVIVDSIVYKNPVLLVIYPITGLERNGVIIFGKVISKEYLRNFFASDKRGIFFLNDSGGISSSNIENEQLRRTINMSIAQEARQVIDGGKHFVKIVNTDNFSGIINISPMLVAPFPVGNGGFFIDESDSFDLQRKLLMVIIGFLSVFIIFFIATFLLIEKIFLKPFRSIVAGIAQISHGELATRIPVSGTRELQEISTGFNVMARSIQKSQTELERKVKQRTAELEKAKVGLERANLGLEKVVAERTAELEKAKASLQTANTGLEKVVAERTAELNGKVAELEKINSLMINRELKMVELKKKIQEKSA